MFKLTIYARSFKGWWPALEKVALHLWGAATVHSSSINFGGREPSSDALRFGRIIMVEVP